MVKSSLNVQIIPMILIHILLIKSSILLFILFKNQIFIDSVSPIWSNIKVVLLSIVYPILIGIITPIRKYKWCFFLQNAWRKGMKLSWIWLDTTINPWCSRKNNKSVGNLGLLRSHALDLMGCMHPSLGLSRSNIMENNGLYIDLDVPKSIPCSEEHA